MRPANRNHWKAGVALGLLALLGACSGGGGGGPVSGLPSPTPPPSPSPSPSPTPPPAPTPTPVPSTAEIRRSDGPEFHNAISVWQQGISGQGATIAIIDSGIDSDSPEFAGRLLPESRDVAGSRGVDGIDDHGTNVAMVAAAARDNQGIVGIAYGANLLMLRADEPGSCTADDSDPDLEGCQFRDADIARGVDAAIAANARVINLSLGGGAPGQELIEAIRRATQAGIVIAVAAGNDGDTTDPALDPDNPDPFAAAILQQGNSAVIIVGSVDENGQISDFSNRAGNFGAGYLTARGEQICCVYDNGQLEVTQQDGSSFVTVISGTSFASPQVAGAVALLAQAFPNLTGQQIVEILLDTARDAGAAGTDAIYGRGILDLANAFAPQGTTRMPGQGAGTQTALSLADDVAIASAPMGNALASASLQSIVLDKYQRAYSYELGSQMRRADDRDLLASAARSGLRSVAVGAPGVGIAFTLDQRGQMEGDTPLSPLRLSRAESDAARVLAARVALRISPKVQLGVAFAEGPEGIAVQVQGRDRPAFLLSRSAAGELGFAHRDGQSVALRQQTDLVGITATASRGKTLTATPRQAQDVIGDNYEGFGFTRFGLAADRRFGPLGLTLGVDWLREERTVLGAYLHDSFGGGGAQSLFVDGSAALDLGDGWRLGADGRYGTTSAEAGGRIAGGSRFGSLAYSADVSKRGVVQDSDRLGLRLSSPLRVVSGGLNFDLPVSYDYASNAAGFAVQRVSLAPDGRELMGEVTWMGSALDGTLAASLFYRSEPGHLRNAPDDRGLLVRWSRGF